VRQAARSKLRVVRAKSSAGILKQPPESAKGVRVTLTRRRPAIGTPSAQLNHSVAKASRCPQIQLKLLDRVVSAELTLTDHQRICIGTQSARLCSRNAAKAKRLEKTAKLQNEHAPVVATTNTKTRKLIAK